MLHHYFFNSVWCCYGCRNYTFYL